MTGFEQNYILDKDRYDFEDRNDFEIEIISANFYRNVDRNLYF